MRPTLFALPCPPRYLNAEVAAVVSIYRAPLSEADLAGTCVDNMKLKEAGQRLLGFDLTRAQRRALDQILDDMVGPAPMLRLLQVRCRTLCLLAVVMRYGQ